MPTDGRFLLDEVDFESLVGQIKRGLYPSDSATHYQDGADWA